MRESILTPGKAALLMLGIGTAALMGVPGVGTYLPPSGALSGTYMDEAGNGLENATVALYHAEDLALVEITHTDQHGRFAFQQAPWSYHLFARPAAKSGYLGTWALARERGPSYGLELVAEQGHPVEVSVLDSQGEPMGGVEVRAYRTGDSPTVLVRTVTNKEGQAYLLCPAQVHLGVFGTTRGHLNSWLIDESVGAERNTFEVQLQAAREFSGRVVDEQGQGLENILVSSSRGAEEWAWHGYARTSESGFFTLEVAREEARLRIVDPDLAYLPLETGLPAGSSSFRTFALTPGRPLEIECKDVGNAEVVSRVWFWSDEAGAWSWGGRTSSQGLLEASVSDGFSIHAEAVFGPLDPTELWNRAYDPARTRLELTHLTSP